MPKIKQTYASYLAEKKPIPKEDGWAVLTKDGNQFSVHLDADYDRAVASAAIIGGTIVRHTPRWSTYWDEDAGAHYDH